MNENEHIFSIPEAAKHCSISRVTLWRWVRAGKLKTFMTPGGHHRIRKHDLELFMNENKMELVSDGGLHEKCILLVDDDPKIKTLLKRFLASGNYRIEEASDGFEAGKKIIQINPDLVILDLYMPKMDGFDVCRQIKHDPDTAVIKVLILTAHEELNDKYRILRLGADSYLTKPIQKAVLLREIHDLIGE